MSSENSQMFRPEQPGYGAEKFGHLAKVMVHNPQDSLSAIDDDNRSYFLFDRVPDVDRYVYEHQTYVSLLKSQEIEVLELGDWVVQNRDLMRHLPNLAYLHDSSSITSRGAILSKMCPGGRQHEEIVVKEALQNLGVPMFFEFPEGRRFESCLLLSPQTLLVAETERHNRKSIEQFIPRALELFDEVVYASIPKLRRFMHADMVFHRVNEHLALAYLPAFLSTVQYTRKGSNAIINFQNFMLDRGMEIINVSDEEQQRWATSFVPIKSDLLIHYDIALNDNTKSELARWGVSLIEFHPDALLAGGGSLRCITLDLLRI